MRILVEYPPLYEEIVRAFPAAKGGGVIFAWGDTIYNPSNILVSRELVAHEMIHGTRQGDNVTAWWSRYLVDPTFRLAEELPAHQAEYWAYHQRHGNSRKRSQYLDEVAQKLASPLYGSLLSVEQARRDICRIPSYRG